MIGGVRPATTGATDAVRIDVRSGGREAFSFFGPHADRLAGTLHSPPGEVIGAAVICPSICSDFIKGYRREVLLARALVDRGIAVQRFHYRGTGNSDGDSSHMSFETMREDALAAARQLSGLAAGAPSFVGTRMGALVAASASAEFGGAPLVLIEPTAEPARFFREGFRARMMHEVKERREQVTTTELLKRLEADRVIDVLGQAVDRLLYESSCRRSLESELPLDPRPLLLVQLGGGELRADHRALAAKWAERGATLEVIITGSTKAWWFLQDEDHPIAETLDPVVEWLARAEQG